MGTTVTTRGKLIVAGPMLGLALGVATAAQAAPSASSAALGAALSTAPGAAPSSLTPTSRLVAAPELSSAQALRAQRILKSVMSPDCPHLTVAACPSQVAAAWRADVRGWVAAGVAGEEIVRRLQERAPNQDLTGQAQGNSPLPVFVSLAGALGLVSLVRRRRRATARAMSAGQSCSAQALASLAELPGR